MSNYKQVSIATSTKKNIPTYNVAVTVTPKGSSTTRTINLSRSFTEWFDAAGHFVAPPFQSMLATSIPTIGKLDPKRVAPVASLPQEAADQKYSAEMLDMLAASTTGSDTANATGSLSAKKGGKRRKA